MTWVQPVFALQVKSLVRNELVQLSQVVVWGEVVQIDIHPVTGYRSAVLEAREVVRAPEEFSSLRDFKIALENRYLRKDDLLERVQGAPELKVGDEVLVFLDAMKPEKHKLRYEASRGETLFSLRGFQQGVYRIFSDENGVRRALSWNQMALPKLSDADLKTQKSGLRKKRSLVSQSLPRESKNLDLPTLDSLNNLVRATPWSSADSKE